MKIWAISDTHGKHGKLNLTQKVLDCDMVIHCGDFANNPYPNVNWVETLHFIDWIKQLPHKHKVIVPGNHDIWVEKNLGLVKQDFKNHNIHLLVHEILEIEGLSIFGSPYTPQFGSNHWAFLKSRQKLGRVWSQIPESTNLLLTHGPPKGKLDMALDIHDRSRLIQVGCSALDKAVRKINPSHHFYGHIHSNPPAKLSNFGQLTLGNTIYCNCSIVQDRSIEINQGHVIKL